MSKSFCILPWIHIATSPSGTLRVCCNSAPGKNHILSDKDGKPLKIYRKDDFRSFWNSTYLKNIRKEMLNGRLPEICSGCLNEELAGVKSARQKFNDEWNHLIQSSIDETKDDGEAEFNPKYIDLRLGNLCNLKCRMCSPWSSSQWTDDWSQLHSTTKDELNWFKAMKNWPETNEFWDQITSIIPSVEKIYLTGGEPTLIDQQFKLLEECIHQGKAKDIELKYNTNVTNISEKLLHYWQHFKRVQLNCSVDGYGKLNRYIRYPSNWRKIDSNLKRLNAIAQTNKNLLLDIHITVQALNVLYLEELFKYIQNEITEVGIPYLNILDKPDYMNVRILSPELKQLVRDKLQGWENKIPKVVGIIDYMNNADYSHLKGEFKRQMEIMDSQRDESLEEICPELHAFLMN